MGRAPTWSRLPSRTVDRRFQHRRRAYVAARLWRTFAFVESHEAALARKETHTRLAR